MKRLLVLLSLLFSSFAYADTINLHWLNEDGTTYQDSTCTVDDDLILPSTPPTRYGYTFTGWEIMQYTPIEYLESTGTQWIDTGIYPNRGSKIEVKGKVINNQFYIGSVASSGGSVDATRNAVVYSSSDNCLHFQKLTTYGGNAKSNIDSSTDFTFIFDTTGTNMSFTLNGTQMFYTTNGVLSNQPNTIKICKSDWDFVFAGRFYYVKIWDSTNTLVRDFIPVLDEDGTPCMYDKVEAKFYYNQGTGQFIAGPEL